MSTATANWPTKALKEVAKIDRNSVPPNKIKAGSLYVGLENITGEGQFDEVRKVVHGELASNKFSFSPKHVLYGKLRPYLSKIARPDFAGICSTDILPILAGHELDRDFLFHFLRRPEMVQFATTRSTGANLPRLSPIELAKFSVPIPKLEEQKRIAAILDKADSIRRDRVEAIEESKKLCPAIFHQMFREVAGRLSGKHIADKDSKLGCELLGTGWKHTTLGKEITLQRGIDITKKEHVAGEVPVISSGGINGFHNKAAAKGPGVVLGRKGSVGSVHYIDVDYWPHDTTLWVREFNGNIARFVYEFFRQFPISKYEASTANPSLNRNNLHPVNVWWPPVSEQQRFADYCEFFDKKLKLKLAKASQESDDLFNSLVQRAFRGEL